jgi:hypothetical protein
MGQPNQDVFSSGVQSEPEQFEAFGRLLKLGPYAPQGTS